MSAFDSIASAASREEATARSAAGGAVAYVEVGVASRRGGIIRAALVAVVAVGALWAAYWQGGQSERDRFDAYVAEERVKATEEKTRQAAALRDVQAASDLRAELAANATTDLQGRIDAYVTQLSLRPVDARCNLTDADLRGLRDPLGGTPARPHRRPAMAARDAD